MKRATLSAYCLGLLMLLGLGTGIPRLLTQGDPPLKVALIVKMVAGVSPADAQATIERNGGTLKSSIPQLGMFVIEVPAESAEAIKMQLSEDPLVQRVEEDKSRKLSSTPSDTYYETQWSLPKIAWNEVYDTVTPTGVADVAILDTGIDASHPDLIGAIGPGTSFIDDSGGRTDVNGHGTWVAGIVAGRTNNIDGIAGVAFSNVQVLPVKVLNADGDGQDSDIINGILWAVEHHASVILMAFSNPGFSANLQDAIDYAWSQGVVLVAAAGNDGSNTPTFPAGDRGVVGVSSTDENDALVVGSNYGPSVFLAAPGLNIVSTYKDGGYVTWSGTSASAAMVAGAAAFMRAVDPALTNGAVVGRLARNADPAGTQEETGNGRLQIARAIADTLTDEVQPSGAPPVGETGPFVGPYQAAAGSLTLTPNTGAVGASVAATSGGGGFHGSSAITFTFNGSSISTTGTCTTNPGGNLVAVCTFTVPNLPPGPYSVVGTDSGSPAFQLTTTFTITGKANQATLNVVVVTPLTYLASETLTTTGGSGTGGVTFTKVSGPCTLVGDQLTADSGTGSCVVNATKAADSNYNQATSADATVTLQKANQATLVTNVTTPLAYLASETLTTTGGSGTGTVTFTKDSGPCTLVGDQLTADSGTGSCAVYATKAADTNYNQATSANATVTLQKANQATLVTNVITPLTYLASETLTTTGGSGTGTVTFTKDSGPCTLVGDQLTADSGTGSCAVYATKAADTNYNQATSANATVTLQKANQATLVTNVTTPLAYLASETLTTTGGSGTGTVTFTKDSGPCTLVGDQLTADSGTGSCAVYATKAADTNYNQATSANATVTLQKANQATLVTNVITPLTYLASETLTTTGGSGTGTVTFTKDSGPCTLVGDQLTADSGTGSCAVYATKAADTNYNQATSANATVTLQKASQATLVTNVTTPLAYLASETLTTTGGSGTGTVTFTKDSGPCTLVGDQLTANSGTGSCVVYATKAADTNYNQATSANATIYLQKLPQAITGFAPTSPLTYSPGLTFGLTATGGGSGNTIIYASTTTLICTVSGSTVTVLTVGDCKLTANQNGNANYYAAPQVNATVTINPGNGLVRYIGQLQFVTSGKSSTTAQVTLSASVQDPTGTGLVGATIDFIDKSNGQVLAGGVKVAPVVGAPGTGTANAIVTLSTGQYGAECYVILVKLTGNYTNKTQPIEEKTAEVVVSKPASLNETIGSGTFEPLATAAGIYSATSEDVTFTVGMKYNKGGSNLQGKMTATIVQSDGVVYIKSTAISSMAITGTTEKKSTIYSKATVYKVLDDESVVTIDGNVSLRVDVDEGSGGMIGFTVLSSKGSDLYYSNQWILSSNAWKTVPQTIVTGTLDIN